MLKLFLLVTGLAMSQWVADAVQASLQPHQGQAWCWAVLVQYVICLTLLVIFDNAPFREAWGPALMLTWIVRTYIFFKRL